MKKYKGAMARYYDKKVKVKRFNRGDLILRKVLQATKDPSRGKLGQHGKDLMKLFTILDKACTT